jgi:predicted site-specific integrase-resolvase
MAPDDVMTLAEWGRRVKLSPTSAWRRMRAGQIEVVNVGSRQRPQLRVTEEAHRKYLAAHRVAA